MSSVRVIGIDPGNYKTGYAILDINGNSFKLVDSGTISARKKPENLKKIFNGLNEIIREFSPSELALESSFYGKNPQVLIKLGEIRGIILLLSAIHELKVFEYTPQRVKNAITGYGWAGKEDVFSMVNRLFNVTPEHQDEADAIAVAFCHFLNR